MRKSKPVGMRLQREVMSLALPASPIHKPWIISGAEASMVPMHYSRGMSACIWECEPGEFAWHYHGDEMLVILAGRAVLDDGTEAGPVEVGPGDAIWFPHGAVVRWRITARVRKYAIWRSTLYRRARGKLGAIVRGALARLPWHGALVVLAPWLDIAEVVL